MRTNLAVVSNVIDSASQRKHFPSPPARIVIYGAGKRGCEIREVLGRRGYNVLAFIDRAALPGASGLGIACLRPDDPEAVSLIRRADVETVIGIWRPDLDLYEIHADLEQRGCRRAWTLYDLAEAFPGAFDSTFWMAPAKTLLDHRNEIFETISLLDDDRSRGIFLECLKLRATGDLASLRSPDRAHPYFPSGIWKPHRPLRMVDCGAYTGDTFSNMRNHGIDFEAYAAFEPDPTNFAALNERFAEGEAMGVERLLYPYGVWSESAQLGFQGGAGEASRVLADGGETVACVSLDEILPGFRPTLIKMDIEGSEPNALQGAAKMIDENHPVLAISIYHKPEHLWEIPLLIRRRHPEYSLFLDYHSFGGNDVVLYGLDVRPLKAP